MGLEDAKGLLDQGYLLCLRGIEDPGLRQLLLSLRDRHIRALDDLDAVKQMLEPIVKDAERADSIEPQSLKVVE